MSQKLRVKPSDAFGIRNRLSAYYFDRAVWMFGSAVQSEMDDAESKSKNHKSLPSKKRMILNKWIPAPQGQTTGRYRDPAIGK